MIRSLLGMFSRQYPVTLVYMLQNTEYHVGPYLKWYWHTNRYDQVMYRRSLHRTRAARMLLLYVRLGILMEIALGLVLVVLWHAVDLNGGLAFGLALLIAYPVVWAHLLVLPIVLGRWFIVRPLQGRAVRASRPRFAKFTGVKIAVAGSYGKTSMKELLLTVLSEGKRVAATPANKNVSVSHAQFVKALKGDEEILIIEYGEGKPGDVARFTRITKPTHAFITGIAPAHLDTYKTLGAAAKDIFSVSDAVDPKQVYVNGDSLDALPYAKSSQQLYTVSHAAGWKISGVKVDITGTRFTMQKGKDKLVLRSALLGRHQVGPLAAVAALAFSLGLSKKQIQAGIAKTAPFEHRMQPYQLGGAWVIDDTYNGNLEGIRAGTKLLGELPAKRKLYVTPGLVDQGRESDKIHQEMGKLIAVAKPDMVVLMEHSVTPSIQKGLTEAGYKGELLLESDPLNFYNNLELLVAKGDLAMLQNDWPDNYK